MNVIVIESAQDYEAVKDRPPVMIQANGIEIPCPCMQTMLAKAELVVANTYNPNAVPDNKMELLRQSILDNGFCFPIVTVWDGDVGRFPIVDGFHRRLMANKEWLMLPYVPIVVLPHGINQRMAATVQFNKARGVHQVDLDADLVRALIQQGMSEEEISVHLGLETEAVHRYKQLTGIAELFRHAEYSTAWEMRKA